MKLTKTQVCLYFYEQLLNVGYLELKRVNQVFDLNRKTFSRYINEIRAYLCNFYKGKEIKYSIQDQRYYLISFNNSVT